MPVVKQIVCLAYSRKRGGYCVAGIDVETGDWIRPVSGTQDGALSMAQCCVPKSADGFREPELLDLLEIEFVEAKPKASQPENWLISDKPWRAAGRLRWSQRNILKAKLQDVPELFRGRDRFVGCEEIKKRPVACSLTLVRPAELHWAADVDQYQRRRILGTFALGDATYTLPLTDDTFAEKLADLPMYKQFAHKARFTALPLLTISLGDAFEATGRHYKLIAGVVQSDLLIRGYEDGGRTALHRRPLRLNIA